MIRRLSAALYLDLCLCLCLASAGCSEDGASDGEATDGAEGGDAPGGDGGGDDEGEAEDDGGGGAGTSEGRIIGYYPAWAVYARDYHVPEIPADLLTHINYAFLNIDSEGNCILGDSYAEIDKFYPGDTWDAGALRGSFHRLQLLKESHPHLKVLLSIGGWTWSSEFSRVAATAESRARFARSCTDISRSRNHGRP